MITRDEEQEMNRLYAEIEALRDSEIADHPDWPRLQRLVERSIFEGRESAQGRAFNGLLPRYNA